MRGPGHLVNSETRPQRFGQKFGQATQPAHTKSETRFRVSGLDFLASLCLLALYVSLAISFPKNSPFLGVVIVITYLIFGEFFIIRKKMLVSSVLIIYFTSQGFTHSFMLQVMAPGYDLTTLKYTPYGSMGLISPHAGMLMIALTSALLFFYWKYSKMPFAFALAALTLIEFPFWFLRMFFADLDVAELDIIMFVGALCLFATAVWWDLSDVYRKSYRTEVAWWCHLFAGVLIINILAYWALGLNATERAPYQEFALAMSAMSIEQGNLVFAIAALALFVSILTDRRHYLVFSLIYLLIATGIALGERSRFTAQAGILLSVLFLGLIVSWNIVRRTILGFLPISLRAQLLRTNDE